MAHSTATTIRTSWVVSSAAVVTITSHVSLVTSVSMRLGDVTATLTVSMAAMNITVSGYQQNNNHMVDTKISGIIIGH